VAETRWFQQSIPTGSLFLPADMQAEVLAANQQCPDEGRNQRLPERITFRRAHGSVPKAAPFVRPRIERIDLPSQSDLRGYRIQ
jgi:hypothetical protein